jgi:hybrid cluster-associated redox disulfide protein
MISKDETVADVLDRHPKTAEVFMKHGMGCLGCAVASGETIEEAASAHGIEIDVLLKELNESD